MENFVGNPFQNDENTVAIFGSYRETYIQSIYPIKLEDRNNSVKWIDLKENINFAIYQS